MSNLQQLASKELWHSYREKTQYAPIVFESISFDGIDLSEYEFMFVTFKDCTFKEATLHESNFRHSTTIHCDFTDAKFWKTKLEGLDVSTCRFNDFPTNCFVDGIRVSKRQAALIEAQRRKVVVV